MSKQKVKKYITIRGLGNVRALGGIGTPIERPQYLDEDTILAIINEGFTVNEYQPNLGIEKRLDRLNYNKTNLFENEVKSHRILTVNLSDTVKHTEKVEEVKPSPTPVIPPTISNPVGAVIAKQIELAETKIGDPETSPSLSKADVVGGSSENDESKSGLFLSPDRSDKKHKKTY